RLAVRRRWRDFRRPGAERANRGLSGERPEMRLSPLLWLRPARGAPGSVRVKLLLFALAASLGCSEPDSRAEAQPAGGKIPAERAGVFQLGDKEYPFLVVRSDLSD